jgi:hypothetical protein
MASLDRSDGPPCDDLLWNDNGNLYYIGRRTYRARDDQACLRCDRRRAREVAAHKRKAAYALSPLDPVVLTSIAAIRLPRVTSTERQHSAHAASPLTADTASPRKLAFGLAAALLS